VSRHKAAIHSIAASGGFRRIRGHVIVAAMSAESGGNYKLSLPLAMIVLPPDHRRHVFPPPADCGRGDYKSPRRHLSGGPQSAYCGGRSTAAISPAETAAGHRVAPPRCGSIARRHTSFCPGQKEVLGGRCDKAASPAEATVWPQTPKAACGHTRWPAARRD